MFRVKLIYHLRIIGLEELVFESGGSSLVVAGITMAKIISKELDNIESMLDSEYFSNQMHWLIAGRSSFVKSFSSPMVLLLSLVKVDGKWPESGNGDVSATAHFARKLIFRNYSIPQIVLADFPSEPSPGRFGVLFSQQPNRLDG